MGRAAVLSSEAAMNATRHMFTEDDEQLRSYLVEHEEELAQKYREKRREREGDAVRRLKKRKTPGMWGRRVGEVIVIGSERDGEQCKQSSLSCQTIIHLFCWRSDNVSSHPAKCWST